MKANELRIGNYVYDEGDLTNPIQIVSVQEDNASWLNPIPLTEDWLIKFGFRGHERQRVKSLCGLTCVNGYWHYTTNGNNEIIILYIHSLQNLYFTLTGEELTIKQ